MVKMAPSCYVRLERQETCFIRGPASTRYLTLQSLRRTIVWQSWLHKRSNSGCRETAVQRLATLSHGLSEERGSGQATAQPDSNVDRSVSSHPTDDLPAKGFTWHANWYPVATLAELQADRPHAVRLLDLHLVVWRDASGHWRALEDKCAHRLAPLSEGRLEPSDGSLMCSYHGWRFDASGACTHIPQAEDERAHDVATSSSRSCVAAFPATTSQGLLWVWPQASPEAHLHSAAQPPPVPEMLRDDCATRSERITLLGDWFVRDFPYGWDHMVENLIDPAHLPWVHHNVVANRNKAKPTEMTVVQTMAADGAMAYEHDGSQPLGPHVSKVRTRFTPPVFYLSQSLAVDGGGREEAMGLSLWFYAVPTGPGQSRLYGKFFLNTHLPVVSWFSKVVPWYFHLVNMDVTDGDMMIIAQQECFLKQPGSNWQKSYYMPTSSDKSIIAFREWLDSVTAPQESNDPTPSTRGSPPVASTPPQPVPWLTPDISTPALNKRKDALLDRWSQHTHQCSSCQGVARGCRNLQKCLWGCALLALVVALLVVDVRNVWGVVRGGAWAGLSALCLAVAEKLRSFERRFYFVDYVHANR